MIGRPLLRLDTVTSTMDVARTLLAGGARPGTAVLAGYQSAGRGRANRTWETPPWSAILCSFITASQRPPGELGVLSLFWGWAVATTVEEFTDQPARIKWPNDVLVDGRKIAGILTTNTPRPDGPRQVTGIGLNVTSTSADLPPTGTSLACVASEAPDLETVLARLFVNLERALELADDRATDHLVTLVQPRLVFLHDTVSIQDDQRVHVGRLDGLDPDGALRLALPNGTITRVVAGDLTRGPRPR